jgi:hypothetical protein
MARNSTNIKKTYNNYHFKPLNTRQVTTFDLGKPDLGFEQVI